MTAARGTKPAKVDADGSQDMRDAGASEATRLTFGENIKAARRKVALSQAQVAEAAGIPQPRLSMIELGKANLTLDTMVSIAGVVGSDVGHLLQKLPVAQKARRAQKASDK